MTRLSIQLEALESQSPADWTPQVGQVYAWRLRATRRANLITGIVIGYDPEKQLVRGRLPSGMTERRRLSDVFLLAHSKGVNP